MNEIIKELNNLNTKENVRAKNLSELMSMLNTADQETFNKTSINLFSELDKNILFAGLHSEKVGLRMATLKLILVLLLNNFQNQSQVIEYFNFFPIGNIICLNWFPSQLHDLLNNNAFGQSKVDFVQMIKTSAIEHKSKFWMWPPNPSFNDKDVPDPLKYLVGVYISDSRQSAVYNSQIKLRQSSQNIYKTMIKFLEDFHLQEEQNPLDNTNYSIVNNASILEDQNQSNQNSRLKGGPNPIKRLPKDKMYSKSIDIQQHNSNYSQGKQPNAGNNMNNQLIKSQNNKNSIVNNKSNSKLSGISNNINIVSSINSKKVGTQLGSLSKKK